MKKSRKPIKRSARKPRAGACAQSAASKFFKMAFYHFGGAPAYAVCVQRFCEAG